jgi:EmrB/QacA subfamily drug resistance transporter
MVLSARQVTVIVGVLALAVFMSNLDVFVVNLAVPYISRDFSGTSLSLLSWVLNGYSIIFAAVLVPAGLWADRIGRRRVLMAGLGTFGVGSLLCGVAPGAPELIGARLIQAVGSGLMVSASLSLLLACVPASARARAIGSWTALGALGATLGPLVGGLLVQASWRWVFWINLPVVLAAGLLTRRVVPDHRDQAASGRPDVPGAVLLAVAVALVALALVRAPAWGWGSFRFIAVLAAAAVCGTVLVILSRRHHFPVIDLGLLRSRAFGGTFAVSILYYAAFGAYVLNTVEFLTGEWRYSAIRAGLAIAPGSLIVLFIARLVAPRLAARVGGAGRVAVLGCAAAAGAQVLWASQLQAAPDYLGQMLPVQLIGGAGIGLTIPSLISVGSAALPPARFGTGSGMLNMARQIGTVLGVSALVAILVHLGQAEPVATFRHAVLLIVAIFAAAGLAAAALLSARPRAVARPAAGRPAEAGVEPGPEPQVPNPEEPMTTNDPVSSEPASASWGDLRSKTLTWYDPALSLSSATGLSGLEYLRGLLSHTVAPPPIAEVLCMRLTHADPGLVVFSCEPDESFYNPLGIVHGGLASGLADSAIGCAVQSTLAAGVGYASIDLTVNFLRPVTAGSGPLIATGRVVKPGRHVAAATAEIHDAAGRLVATASSNCLIIGAS